MSNITGLENLNVDEIECYSINTNYISNDEINTLKGSNINLTLQSQINTLNSVITSGNNGGGFFCITATQNSGFIANTYWGYNSGTNPTVNIPLVFSYEFKVNSITFTCLSIPSTQATVYLYKNGNIVYTMSHINTTSITFSNINVIFLANDTFNIFTGVGGGGGQVRATVSCSVGGVVGATPQLSIGTVSSLSSTSQPTVSITGNTLNPVLNFGLVQGVRGVQGVQGVQGVKGDKGEKGDTGDSSFQTQLNTTAIAALGATCTGLQTEIDGIITTIAGIETEIATIDGEITTMDEEIGTLQTDIQTLEDNVDTLQQDVQTLQDKTQYITANTQTATTEFNNTISVDGEAYINDIFTVGTTQKIINGSLVNVKTFTVSPNGNVGMLGDLNVDKNVVIQDKLTVKGVSLPDTTLEDGRFNVGEITALKLDLGDNTNTKTHNIQGNTINMYNTTTNIDGNAITIGHSSVSGYTITNFKGNVYFSNGVVNLETFPNSGLYVPLIPWSAASSFFSQW